MSSAITVQGLGKKYVLSHQRQERYIALRDVISNGARNWAGRLFSRTTEKNVPTHEEFWALKDLNLESSKAIELA